MPDSRKSDRFALNVLLIAALCLSLCVITFAVIYSADSVQGNMFQTGTVDIDITDITDEAFNRFEPGMTVTKSFTVTNRSTCDVYYKVYLTGVGETDLTGKLADILDVCILDGNTVLFSGKAGKLTRNVAAFGGTNNGVLKIKDTRDLTIEFHYPESAGNAGQAEKLSFRLCAEATQTKNNRGKEF